MDRKEETGLEGISLDLPYPANSRADRHPRNLGRHVPDGQRIYRYDASSSRQRATNPPDDKRGK